MSKRELKKSFSIENKAALTKICYEFLMNSCNISSIKSIKTTVCLHLFCLALYSDFICVVLNDMLCFKQNDSTC